MWGGNEEKKKQYAEKYPCFSEGKILQRTFLSHQIPGELFFVKVGCINYGDIDLAHVKLDGFFTFQTNPESVSN